MCIAAANGQLNMMEEEVSHRAPKRSFDIAFKHKVVSYAELNSKAGAARVFNVDRKCVQRWTKQKNALESIDLRNSKQKRLEGAGRKAANSGMEEKLYRWICDLREQRLHVTRKMAVNKALHLYLESDFDDNEGEYFILLYN